MSVSRKNLHFFLSLDGLGGPITSTPVDGLSLFPRVMGTEAEKGVTDYRCFYFINRDPNPDGLIDVRLWFDRAPNESSLAVGVDPAGQNREAQRIASVNDSPDGVHFSVPGNDVLPMYLPGKAYLEGDYVALWLRRTVPAGSPPQTERFLIRVRGESF